MESFRASFCIMLCLIGATFVRESVAWRHKITAVNATHAGLEKDSAQAAIINGAGVANPEALAPWQQELAAKRARRGPSPSRGSERSPDRQPELTSWQKEAQGLLKPADVDTNPSTGEAWKAVTPEALEVMFDAIVDTGRDHELPTVSEGGETVTAVRAVHWQLYFVGLAGFTDEDLNKYVMPLWMSIMNRIDPDHSSANLLTKEDLKAWWAAGGFEDLEQEPKFLEMLHAKLKEPTAVVEVVARKIGDQFDGVDDANQLSFNQLFNKAKETGLADPVVLQALQDAWKTGGEQSGHDQGYITGSTVHAFKEAFRAAFAARTA